MTVADPVVSNHDSSLPDGIQQEAYPVLNDGDIYSFQVSINTGLFVRNTASKKPSIIISTTNATFGLGDESSHNDSSLFNVGTMDSVIIIIRKQINMGLRRSVQALFVYRERQRRFTGMNAPGCPPASAQSTRRRTA